jgi:hypothetical protein
MAEPQVGRDDLDAAEEAGHPQKPTVLAGDETCARNRWTAY